MPAHKHTHLVYVHTYNTHLPAVLRYPAQDPLRFAAVLAYPAPAHDPLQPLKKETGFFVQQDRADAHPLLRRTTPDWRSPNLQNDWPMKDWPMK